MLKYLKFFVDLIMFTVLNFIFRNNKFKKMESLKDKVAIITGNIILFNLL